VITNLSSPIGEGSLALDNLLLQVQGSEGSSPKRLAMVEVEATLALRY
jgi:hypothetical protein